MTLPTKIKNQIIAELNSITTETSFTNWLNDETIPPTFTNPLILVNNSFFFREKIKSNKSEKYLAFKVNKTNKRFDTSKCYVVQGLKKLATFKIIDKNDNRITAESISSVISTELSDLGELVFTLIGEIQDVYTFSEEVKTTDIKKITLNPNHHQDFEFVGTEVIVKKSQDRNFVITEVKNHLTANGKNIPEEIEKTIDKTLTEIEKKAYCDLTVPTSINPSTDYFLDLIVNIIDGHINNYRTHLPNISTNPQSYNEVLRVSYNFVSDVNKLMELLINVCDIKPLISWMTISKYFKIENSFQNLPKGFSNKKPDIKEYESIVKNARNKTFHQLFPFSKSLEFNITRLNDIKLRMFSDYGNKKQNQLTFQDKELADLLLGFTRVVEQNVSDEFWRKNLDVMIAINEMIKAVSKSLKLIKE